MRSKVLTALLLTAALATGQAQTRDVKVTFPSEAPREVWVAAPGRPASGDPKVVDASTVTVPITSVDPKAYLYVVDRRSGNLARLPVAKATSTWRVRREDFNRLAQVGFRLISNGRPVAAAQVELKDSGGTRQDFVDPSSKGQVEFWDVAPGKIQATVRYKTEGRDATPVVQLFDVPLQRESPDLTLIIALPEPTETVRLNMQVGQISATPSANGQTEPPTGTSPRGNILGQIIVYVLGAAVAVGGILLAMRYMKANADKVEAKLTDLGVQIPKPGDPEPDDSPIPPPAPAKPAPPEKILLDAGTPDLMPAAVPVATVAPTGQPRLVTDTGDELPLEEGELVVGRDTGLGLSLPDESTVSRRHATLVRTGNQVSLRDLGSTNGTFVNGVKVQDETVLRPGDSLQFGMVRFRFEG